MATVTVMNAVKDNNTGATITTPISMASANPPSGWMIGLWMAAVVVAAVGMGFLYRYIKPSPIRLMAGYVPYAGVIATAAALERFLEPLSQFLLPNETNKKNAATSKVEALTAAASTEATDVQAKVRDAADAQAAVDRCRRERTIMFWAIASICGLAISGGFGLFLLQSVAISPVSPYLDLVVTGLTIGAGTKPTHDLITSIQARATKSA